MRRKLRLLSLLMGMLAMVATNAFAGGGNSHTTHYGKVTVTSNGNGSVYISTSSTATSGDTEVTWNCNGSSGNDTKTYYLFAKPEGEYVFTGWDDGVKDSPRAVSKKAESTDANSPSVSPYKAIFKHPDDIINYSDWMAKLPDWMYITNLSIPGTHDSGTSGLSGISKTQSKTIPEQLSAGIRAFDYRPGVNGDNLNIYHGIDRTNITLDNAFGYLKTYLTAHPTEFVFVVMRHENDTNASWGDKVRDCLNKYKDIIVDFAPNMCVGQMRGKILLMSRDGYTDGPVGTYVNGWADNTTFDSNITSQFGDRLNIKVQDIYDGHKKDKQDEKKSAIVSMLAEAMAGNSHKLYINHTSGCNEATEIFGAVLNSEKGIRNCAAECNKIVIDYLAEHAGGPTGIIMTDFGGADTYSGTTVYGQALVDRLIENCYETANRIPELIEWVAPYGSDRPWKAKYVFKDDPNNSVGSLDALPAPAGNWNATDFDDSSWAEQWFPMANTNNGKIYCTRWTGEYNSYWIRREFSLDGVSAQKKYIMRAFHDDDYEVYVNGNKIREATGWNESSPEEVEINPSYLKKGTNVLAIHIQQNWGGAYFDCGIYTQDVEEEPAPADEGNSDVTFSVMGGSNYGQVEGCDKAFDNNTATKWYMGSNDQFVVLEASRRFCLTGLALTTANDNKQFGRLPREWEIYGTNDMSVAKTLAQAGSFSNEGWTLIHSQRENSYIIADDYTPHHLAVNPHTESFKYIVLKNVISPCQLSEISFTYSKEKQVSYSLVEACGSYNNEDAGKALDSYANTKLCTNVGDVYMVFTTSEAIRVGGYTFVSGNDAPDRDPNAWRLYAKRSAATPNRGDGDWVLIDEVTNGARSFADARRSYAHFTINSPKSQAFNCFKLEITGVRGGAVSEGHLTQFCEFYLTEGADSYSRMTNFGAAGRQPLTRLWDGNAENYWYADNETPAIFGNGHANALEGYTLQMWRGYYPTSWTLYGSTSQSFPDAGGAWEEIHSVSDNSTQVSMKALSYVFDEPTKEYNFFKLVALGNGDGNTTVVIGSFVPYFYRNDKNNQLKLTDGKPVRVLGGTTVKALTYERNTTSGNVITFVLPAAIPVSEVNGQVWQLSEYLGDALKFEKVTEGILHPNQPYLLESTGSTLLADNRLADAKLASTPAYEGLKLEVNGAYQLGSYESRRIEGIDGTVYGYTGGRFVQANSGTLNPYRTFFVVESGNGIREMSLFLEDEETGVITIDEDGQLEDRLVDVYDLNGRKVRSGVAGSTSLLNLQRGIYIINGKKYSVK